MNRAEAALQTSRPPEDGIIPGRTELIFEVRDVQPRQIQLHDGKDELTPIQAA